MAEILAAKIEVKKVLIDNGSANSDVVKTVEMVISLVIW